MTASTVATGTTAAENLLGVKGVYVIQDKGSEIHWSGDDIVVVAAVDEPTAADAARLKSLVQHAHHRSASAWQPHECGVPLGRFRKRRLLGA